MGESGFDSACKRAAYVQTESSFLFPALAGVAAIITTLIYGVLIVCYLLMARDPSHGFWPSAETVEQIEPTVAANPPDGDPDGGAKIDFVNEGASYFYRKNAHAGNILILAGRVRNNYLEPRSFIKLRGFLLGRNDKVLAERSAYAGNFLHEDDLFNLPMAEINNLLLVKGGQDNANVNVQPGTELKFMLVFDNLPDGMEEYRIDAVSSEPAK